mgnify:CR=1 FL=1
MPMSPEEKQVIAGIFDRLKQAESMPRDADAEKFIADQVKAQPYAPYVMAQAIHMQEQALGTLQQQMQDMQGQIAQLQGQLAQAQQPKGFLGGLFGGGAPAPQPMQQQRPMGMPPQGGQFGQPPMGQPMMAPGQQAAGGPWSRGPMGGQPGMPFGGQQQPAAGGGGFLRTAAAAAVGVAGGMLVASALSNAFGGGSASAAPAAGSGLEPVNATPPLPPENPAAQDFGASAQPASWDQGGDSWGGGGGDWGGGDEA